jgi:hypothetical protein
VRTIYDSPQNKAVRTAKKRILDYLKDHSRGAKPSVLAQKIARVRDRITEDDVRSAWSMLLGEGRLDFTDDLKLTISRSRITRGKACRNETRNASI